MKHIYGLYEGDYSGFDASTMKPNSPTIIKETVVLHSGATLRNVAIEADTCIILAEGNPYTSNITVENCYLKGKTGITVEDRTGNTLYGTLRIRNNIIVTTHIGISLFNCNDWCILENNEVQPGFFGHDVSEGSERYIAAKNCVAYDLSGLQDWTILENCCSWATLMGLRCTNTIGPINVKGYFDAAMFPIYLHGSVDKLFYEGTMTAFNPITQELGTGIVVDWQTNVNILNAKFHFYGPSNKVFWTGGVPLSKSEDNGITKVRVA